MNLKKQHKFKKEVLKEDPGLCLLCGCEKEIDFKGLAYCYECSIEVEIGLYLGMHAEFDDYFLSKLKTMKTGD